MPDLVADSTDKGAIGGQVLRKAPEARSRATAASPLRICLAASGGGHLRQLLDLKPAWSAHDHFFLTEDTALSQSLASAHRTHFVAHVALGQARLGAPFQMLRAAWRNFFQSVRVILRERPNVLISTGAGAAFSAVLCARLIGAKVVMVESFARFDHPSKFARLAAPLAHHKVVQSVGLAAKWAGAAVFDPLRILDTAPPPKEPLLLATVGATLPFDRLLEMVAAAKANGEIPERVLMQTGVGGKAPRDAETFETLSFDDMNAHLSRADIVVCHGGTGSLIMALKHGCRIIAVPRQFEMGEHYDDHQSQITSAFAQRGLIAVANTPAEFTAALKSVRARPPVVATSDPAELIAHLRALFETWAGQNSRRRERLPRR